MPTTKIIGQPKLRGTTKLFMRGGKVRAWHVIEIKHDKKWTLLGDDKDFYAFESAAERDTKIQELLAPIEA
jgi:hypothetical protein